MARLMMVRMLRLFFIALLLSGCELIGDLFQAGVVAGVLVVFAILGIVAWLLGKARGRRP